MPIRHLRRKTAMPVNCSLGRTNSSLAHCDRLVGDQNNPGSCDHAFARRLFCDVLCWYLRNRDERDFVSPGPEGAGASWACGTAARHGSTCSTTARRHGAACAAARHGPSSAASGNGAPGRTGVPSGSPATASRHGAASDPAFHRATCCSSTTRVPPARRPAWSGGAAASNSADRRTIAPEYIARFERAAVATGAG